MIKEITIDFLHAKNEKEVIGCFVEALGLPIVKYPNWDGFNDYFRNLDSDSTVISTMNPLPEGVHLILKNLGKVAGASRKVYGTLCEILVEATDINRQDGIKFTFNTNNEYRKKK